MFFSSRNLRYLRALQADELLSQIPVPELSCHGSKLACADVTSTRI